MNDNETLGPVLPDEDQTTKRIMHLIVSLSVSALFGVASVILYMYRHGN